MYRFYVQKKLSAYSTEQRPETLESFSFINQEAKLSKQDRSFLEDLQVRLGFWRCLYKF